MDSIGYNLFNQKRKTLILSNLKSNRLIGRFDGTRRGNLVIVIGALHGNEPAGVVALQTVFQQLNECKQIVDTNDQNFNFEGRLVGFIGNLRAFQKRVRFVAKDMNRQFTIQKIAAALMPPYRFRDSEDRELDELLTEIRAEIIDYQPNKIFLLDIHSTSAQGGIFAIPFDTNTESVSLATALHVPVVTGMMTGISGTTLHFFNGEAFGVPSTAAAFEAGQHDDPRSADRAKAVIFNLLRHANCIKSELFRDAILEEDNEFPAESLPLTVDLKYVHRISDVDEFRMRPGFRNFQPIEKGQWLADDKNGQVLSPAAGRILMPLYQPQGREGFFIVQN
jgi:succinylglutamate desuccinylase